METNKDELFGYLGIDSKYEKELIYYRPLLEYLKDTKEVFPEIELNQDIQRAEMFPVYQIIYDYQELIDELSSMFALIRKKEDNSLLDKIETYYKSGEYDKIYALENENDTIYRQSYLEYYTTGLFLMDTLSFRLDEVIDKFVSQYTSETEPEAIEKAEKVSISEWKQLEQKSVTLEEDYENNLLNIENEDEYEYDSVIAGLSDELESLKEEKYNLHTTLADLGYIHRNRYFMIVDIIDGLYSLVETQASILENDLDQLIFSMFENRNVMPSIKAHLLVQYKQAKDEHNVTKNQYTNYHSAKESLANDKQYFYQQLNNKTKSDLANYFYSTMEDESSSVEAFNTILIGSLVSADQQYNDVLAEILNFYKEEATFYQEILLKIQNKEKLKVYYRICEDLEEKDTITSEWVADYVATLTEA